MGKKGNEISSVEKMEAVEKYLCGQGSNKVKGEGSIRPKAHNHIGRAYRKSKPL